MLSILEACIFRLLVGFKWFPYYTHKILQCGYYWPTIHQDTHDFSMSCDHCQREGFKEAKVSFEPNHGN